MAIILYLAAGCQILSSHIGCYQRNQKIRLVLEWKLVYKRRLPMHQ